MDVILQEVKLALESNLYYLAVMTALSLPDICAALESPTGKTDSIKYMTWCDANIDYEPLTSKDLYSLRCGVLHQGMFEHPNITFKRVLFTLPTRNFVFHKNVTNGALNLDATTFCEDVMKAVTDWYEVKKEDPNVVKNMPRLIQYRANGFLPYMKGMPLIG